MSCSEESYKQSGISSSCFSLVTKVVEINTPQNWAFVNVPITTKLGQLKLAFHNQLNNLNNLNECNTEAMFPTHHAVHSKHKIFFRITGLFRSIHKGWKSSSDSDYTKRLWFLNNYNNNTFSTFVEAIICLYMEQNKKKLSQNNQFILH